MTEAEAYGGQTGWMQRANQKFSTGEVVRLGPAYRMGGSYAPDGKEGIYTVLGPFGYRDYYLAKGVIPAEEVDITLYEVIAPASRLTKVESP